MSMHKVLHPRDDNDCMCQEKEEKEDFSALKFVQMHQHKDLKTMLKRLKKD